MDDCAPAGETRPALSFAPVRTPRQEIFTISHFSLALSFHCELNEPIERANRTAQMEQEPMTPAAQIDKAQRIVGAIDKRIDAVRIELFRNEVVDDLSAHSWQMAWDKHPVLRAIETSLFLRRADAADIRDHLIAKAEKAAERRAVRASLKQYQLSRHECPTCGLTHLAA